VAHKVKEFIGSNLDEASMTEVVDDTLYRQRG